jgi:hypothetical protein
MKLSLIAACCARDLAAEPRRRFLGGDTIVEVPPSVHLITSLGKYR